MKTTTYFLLILIALACTETTSVILKPDYKYFAVTSIDFDGTKKAYDHVLNKHYTGARTDSVPEPLDVICFLEDTILINPLITQTNVLINDDFHDDRIYYNGQWWPLLFRIASFSEWLVPIEVTNICTDYLCFQWVIFGPFDCDGLTLPIELHSFDITQEGNNYRFEIETADEYQVDQIYVEGSNDFQTWIKLDSVQANNEPSRYTLHYQR